VVVEVRIDHTEAVGLGVLFNKVGLIRGLKSRPSPNGLMTVQRLILFTLPSLALMGRV
jgi:hypothetical protein